MSCTKNFLGVVPAPPGWVAHFVVLPQTESAVELTSFPVACWMLQHCEEHGPTLQTLIMTARGQTSTLEDIIQLDERTAEFLVLVAPNQNADKLVRAALHARSGDNEHPPTDPENYD